MHPRGVFLQPDRIGKFGCVFFEDFPHVVRGDGSGEVEPLREHMSRDIQQAGAGFRRHQIADVASQAPLAVLTAAHPVVDGHGRAEDVADGHERFEKFIGEIPPCLLAVALVDMRTYQLCYLEVFLNFGKQF